MGEQKRPRFVHWTLVAVWLALLVYTVYMSAFSIRKHDAFLTNRADLGHFDQTLWNTLHGRVLIRTDAGQQMLSFTDHVEPILVPLSLIYLVWEDVRALLIFQTAAIALGALPVYWLARDELLGANCSPSAARLAGLGLALVYLLFPGLQAANLTEFHATTLVVTPMLMALYCARQGRYASMWLWAVVVMVVKEEMPLLTFMLGLWLLFSGKQRKQGLALAAASLAWCAVAVFLITPRYAPIEYGVDQSVHFERYAAFGDSPGEIVRTVLLDPGLVWQTVSQPDRVSYLVGLLASGGLLLPLLAPEVLLLGLPILAANLLSSYEAMISDTYHYTAPLVPFFLAAAAVGLARMARLVNRWQRGQGVVLLATAMVLLGSLIYHRFHGYTPLARNLDWPQVTYHHRLLETRFAVQIPPDAVLATTAPLFPHLDHRERILQLPRVADATWVLIDAASYAQMHPAKLRQRYEALIASQAWCIVDAADGYVLLERRDGPEGDCLRDLPDAFYDFARVDDPQPQVWMDAEFGGKLRLLGYDVTSVPQFQRVGLRLYWTWTADDSTLDLAGASVRLYPFWLGEGGEVVETTDQRPLVEPIWYPPEHWQPGEVIVTEMMPWNIGPAFRLGIAVLDEAGRRLPVQLEASGEPAYVMDGGTWLRLGLYGWRDGEVQAVNASALPEVRVNAEFSGQVALAGYQLSSARLRPGDDLALRLHWQALGMVEHDYTVFVHLLNGAGERLAQHDGPANYYGELPTTLWQAGLPVLDHRNLSLAADLAPGKYDLVVGLYDRETGQRLLLPTGEDSYRLAQVQIE
jgi:uncharacterized membrane protein